MTQSVEGTLLTLNLLRPRASADSLQDGIDASACQAEATVHNLERGGLSIFDVLLQVDEKRMLGHQRGAVRPAAPDTAAGPSSSSPTSEADSSPSSSSSSCAPSLLSVSPLCLSSHAGSAAIKQLLITGRNLLSSEGTCVRARCQGNFLSVSCGAVEQDGASPGAVPGQQCMPATLHGVPPSCGALILVELQHGGALGGWRPVVVVPSPKVAMEVNSLQSAESPLAGGDFLVADLGRWLDYASCVAGPSMLGGASQGDSSGGGSGGGGKGKASGAAAERAVESAAVSADGGSRSLYYANAGDYCAALVQAVPRDRMLSTGLHLLSAAADRGWPHTCQLLVDSLLAVGVDYDWVVGMTNARGPSLLVRAVRSKSVETVQAVYRMGEAHDHSWRWDASQAHGLTALHVAAVVPDDGHVARAIVRAYPAAARLWQTAKAFDGLTPADCAARCGRDALNAAVQLRLKELASPFQSQEQEDDAHGRPQRLLASGGIDPEEMKRVVQEAAAHARRSDTTPDAADADATTSGRSTSATSTSSSAARRGSGGSAAASAAAAAPSGAEAVLRCCAAGRFESAALEARYRGQRTVQALSQDQLVYPLLVVLLAASVAISHLKQGGGFVALVTVLLGLAGQLALVYFLTHLPALYLRRRQELWLASQLARPALLLAVAAGLLPLPLSWAGPSAANALAHALLLPALEHLSVPHSGGVRVAGLVAEVAVAVTCGSPHLVAAVAYAAAVAACGLCVSTVMDFMGRSAFLAASKSD